MNPLPASPLLVVISAPSGGGKTTLCQQLLAHHPEMSRAITCTTRPPREGELDGRDYYFLDNAEFERRVHVGAFLEYAHVFGRSYGTPAAEVLDKLRQGRDVLLNIDIQGAATVCARAAADPELRQALVTVFLTPPSIRVLEQRLRRRATDADAELQKRLALARHEIAQWTTFQYLILSTSIPEDLRRMEAILDAERMRSTHARFAVSD
jgi:guanylate kinase